MEAIFLVCGAGGPQLKRNPLGCPSKFMPFWGWILLSLGALAALVRWGNRPIYYRHRTLDEVSKLLGSFLGGMDTGAVWVAEREAGPGFLQLALVANKPLEQAIELGLPEVDWSEGRFDAVLRAVQAAGLTSELETSETGPVRRFLRVRCTGLRPALLQTALHLITVIAQALDWETAETYTVHWGGTPPGPQSWRQILDGLD